MSNLACDRDQGWKKRKEKKKGQTEWIDQNRMNQIQFFSFFSIRFGPDFSENCSELN